MSKAGMQKACNITISQSQKCLFCAVQGIIDTAAVESSFADCIAQQLGHGGGAQGGFGKGVLDLASQHPRVTQPCRADQSQEPATIRNNTEQVTKAETGKTLKVGS
jgi:hypothetical protein